MSRSMLASLPPSVRSDPLERARTAGEGPPIDATDDATRATGVTRPPPPVRRGRRHDRVVRRCGMSPFLFHFPPSGCIPTTSCLVTFPASPQSPPSCYPSLSLPAESLFHPSSPSLSFSVTPTLPLIDSSSLSDSCQTRPIHHLFKQVPRQPTSSGCLRGCGGVERHAAAWPWSACCWARWSGVVDFLGAPADHPTDLRPRAGPGRARVASRREASGRRPGGVTSRHGVIQAADATGNRDSGVKVGSPARSRCRVRQPAVMHADCTSSPAGGGAGWHVSGVACRMSCVTCRVPVPFPSEEGASEAAVTDETTSSSCAECSCYSPLLDQPGCPATSRSAVTHPR